MNEFLNLVSLESALEVFRSALDNPQPLRSEAIRTESALSRFLAEDISSTGPLPPFDRSTVDGFAVRAQDTFGATSSLPSYLKIAGEIRMGTVPGFDLKPGESAIIHTGGMIPEGADAVVMLEDTQTSGKDEVEILRPVAVGENVLKKGEDVVEGETVILTGTRLRPQEIGGLLALGITQIHVFVKPHIGVISTGDELVNPVQTPGGAQVRDINSYTLASLIERQQGEPILRGIIPDDFEAVAETIRKSHEEDDIVIVTAGSSVSARDITASAIEKLGPPGILVHGLSIKPGKPTILAVAGGKPLIGLPGNPVSALVIASLILPTVIQSLLRVNNDQGIPTIRARLSTNIPSQAGREDFVPVHLSREGEQWVAEPVRGRSNLIFTLIRANGLVRIPPEITGMGMDTIIEVLPI